MNSVIIDHRASSKIKTSLLCDGFEIIEMPSWERLQMPVSAHPDMLTFIADKTLIAHRDYYNIAKKQFSHISSLGYEIVLSDEVISCDYPHDILFNCVEFKNAVFGKENSVSKYIKKYAQSRSKVFVNVKQGYTKCSVARVSENAAITADKAIYKALTENGVDALLISEGNVKLDGYGHGFIGGCTGLFEDKLYFMGNVDLHPDGERIKSFCKKHKTSPILLSDELLFDGGSLFFI